MNQTLRPVGILVILLIGLSLSVWIDPYIGRRKRNVLLLIAGLDLGLIAQNLADVFLQTHGPYLAIRTLVGVIGYCLRPLILLLFFDVVNDDRAHTVPRLLVGVNTAVYCTAFFSNICFTIDANNHFQRGPLGYTCHVISAILLAYHVYLTMASYGRLKRRETIIPILNACLVIGAVLLDKAWMFRDDPVSSVTVAVVCSSVFYYIWLHLQFVREHENALLAEQRIQLLMAQIKPHFIFNSLTAIRSLLNEPDKAEDALNHFARFLRGSIDVLEETGCIRADQEFAAVESYLYLEKERFGAKLTVETELLDTDFYLPPFTVQTLVENAIHHGIHENPSGRGMVRIRSYQTAQAHVVEVEDDGKGFVPAQGPEAERTHIGLSNVQERLMLMCGGTLSIETARDRGTLATVRIPKSGTKAVPSRQAGPKDSRKAGETHAHPDRG